MGTKQENDEAHTVTLAKMTAQLKVWSTQLDELIASGIKAGAQPNDAHRVRVDELRTLLGVVQTRLHEFNAPPGERGPWGAFRADIADDWNVLKDGIRDLAH